METPRLKVLLSAYACEPARGSEPGVGWNLAVHLARHHDVWVLTRTANREVIEAERARLGLSGLHVVYHDLPRWARFWKRGMRGIRLYYYLWQLTAIPLLRCLHRQVRFDVVQHVTFVKYWAPCALAFLKGVPLIWGPIGGGESAPRSFWGTLGVRGLLYEAVREGLRTLSEWDPLVRLTARRARVALAVTSETAQRIRRLGVRSVQLWSQVGLSMDEVQHLAPVPGRSARPLRFLSIGNLLALKGFHLGLQAFAASGVSAEYWIIGEGPERRRLEALARKLGVAERVRLPGALPRAEVFRLLRTENAVLVHPGLHDSGGWVCLEAMAAGCPVICLDLGGPAHLVPPSAGFRVSARDPRQAVDEMAIAMRQLAEDPETRMHMGEIARQHVLQHYVWEQRAAELSTWLTEWSAKSCPVNVAPEYA